MKFMADQFAADIRVALLRNEQPSFAEALAEELALRGRVISEAFTDFQRWFEVKRFGGG